MLFAGIDGGQSSTVAVIGDDTRVLGRGSGPPADLVGEADTSQRQGRALESALRAALAEARLSPGVRFARIVAGISGFEEGLSARPELPAFVERVDVVHDTVVAHAGALGGAPGIVVIAGTGSVAIGNARADGAYVRAGGWGYFFGDEGSALWIARSALRAAMEAEDRGRESALREHARAFFGAPTLRYIQHAFAHGELTRATLATFAREVLAIAAREPVARAICDRAATELAACCAIVDGRLGPRDSRRVSYAGGLFASADFAAAFAEAASRAMPALVTSPPVGDAAMGALGLARMLSNGISVARVEPLV